MLLVLESGGEIEKHRRVQKKHMDEGDGSYDRVGMKDWNRQ